MPNFYIHGQIHMYIIMSSFVSGICVGKREHGMDNYLLIGTLVHIMMCQYTNYKSGTVVWGCYLFDCIW